MTSNKVSFFAFFAIVCSSVGTVSNATLTTGCHDHAQIIHNSVDLDVNRFDGVWFEQVRTEGSPFEDECFCSQANYTLGNSGDVRIENTCRKGSAASPISSAHGTATTPYPAHPGFLLVSFYIPFIKSSYIVIDTDYTEYAIVASCPRFFGNGLVWILTRDQAVQPEFIDHLKNKTSEFGFSRAMLIDTYQGSHCNDSNLFRPTVINTQDHYYDMMLD